MIRHRTKNQVWAFDIFKMLVLLILIVLAFFAWQSSGLSGESPAAGPGQRAGQPVAGQPETESPATETPTPEPQIAAPTLNPLPAGLVAGPVDFSGSAEPGSKLAVIANRRLLGMTNVDNGGNWALTAELREPGDYQIELCTLGEGGVVLAEAGPLPLSLAAPPVEEVPTETPAPQPTPTEAPTPTPQPTATPAPTPTPKPPPAPPALDAPAAGLAPGEVELTGTGEPGSQVEIVIDGQVAGVATVGPDGKWRFSANLPDAGNFDVSLRAVDANGNTLAESEATRLTLTAPEAPATDAGSDSESTGDSSAAAGSDSDSGSGTAGSNAAAGYSMDGQAYIVQADDWLSKLAQKFYGDMFTYPVIVDATNAKAATDSSFDVIDNPDLIEIGQKLWIPAAN